MPLLKKGTKVSWPAPAPEGVIERARVINDEVQYLVNYADAAGEAHQRYFAEADLTVTEEAPVEEPK
jgi:hypothetical protein